MKSRLMFSGVSRNWSSSYYSLSGSVFFVESHATDIYFPGVAGRYFGPRVSSVPYAIIAFSTFSAGAPTGGAVGMILGGVLTQESKYVNLEQCSSISIHEINFAGKRGVLHFTWQPVLAPYA